MKVIKNIANWPLSRVVASSASIVVGAACSVVSQDPSFVAAGTGFSAAGIQFGSFLSAFGNNFLASHFYDQIRTDSSPDLLENHDLRRMTGKAIAECIREGIPRADQADKPSLKKLADIAEEGWIAFVGSPMHDGLQPASEENIVSLFQTISQADSLHVPPVLRDDWHKFLVAIAKHKGLSEITDGAFDRAANKIEQLFLRMLYEAAKREFANQSEAYAALQLRLLNEILFAVKKQASQPDFDQALESHMGELLVSIEKAVANCADYIRNHVQDAANQLNNRARQRCVQLLSELQQNRQEILSIAASLDSIQTTVEQTGETTEEIKAAVEGNRGVLNEVKSLLEDHEGQKPATETDSANGSTEPTCHHNLGSSGFANRFFVGRKALLTKLRKSFEKSKTTALTQAIHGLGGVGKTQLALQFAIESQKDYSIIWWIRAEDRSTMMIDLAALAVPLGIVQPGQQVQDQEQLVAAVLSALANHGRCLLIYDNVEDKADLNGRMPTGGHILITSRQSNWRQIAKELSVNVMGKGEARKLIQDRSGQRDGKSADEIAVRLGHLPLALEVAGAYCASTGLKLKDYLSLLEEIGLPLLDEEQPVDYQHLVSTAWQPSIAKAFAESESAKRLFSIMACVAPDNFPVDLLDNEIFGGRKGLLDAIKSLRKYSLIVQQGDGISIHRLVQEILFTKISGDEKDASVEAALILVNRACPGDTQTNLDSWPVIDRLLPHAGRLFELVDESRDRGENNPLSRLLNQIAIYYFSRANFALAEPLMRRALSIDESSYGENHPDVAIDLNNLAQLLQATNRLSEAEPLMRRALSIDESSYGENHPKVAIRLNNLAQLLKATNRLSEAEPLMRRALSIDESSYGENHPKVAIDLNNLAQLLQATNRLSEAEPLMRRALSIDESSYGENHPDVAIDLNNLAQLLQATNRLSEAEPLMRRALSIDESSYGENHPKVAIRLNNLAQLLKATNRLSEAEPLMRRALSIDESSYGENHPDVARDLNNLAQLLQATNRLSEAEPLMRRALSIDESSYGENHPDVAIDLNNLAQLLQATNRLSEAEPLMRRALGIFITSLGVEHPNAKTVLGNYVSLLEATGLSKETAETQAKQCIEAFLNGTTPDDNPST